MQNWKGRSQDLIYFWQNHKLVWPSLSLLVLNLFNISVTNSNVEKSIKCLGSIVTFKRPTLGLDKIKQEMTIKFNKNSHLKNSTQHTRMHTSFENFKKIYEKSLITTNEEMNIILKIDSMADPMKLQIVQVNPQVGQNIQDPEVIEINQNTVRIRKTKIFEIFENYPDYLPVKRCNRSNVPLNIIDYEENEVSEDNNDDDYVE